MNASLCMVTGLGCGGVFVEVHVRHANGLRKCLLVEDPFVRTSQSIRGMKARLFLVCMMTERSLASCHSTLLCLYGVCCSFLARKWSGSWIFFSDSWMPMLLMRVGLYGLLGCCPLHPTARWLRSWAQSSHCEQRVWHAAVQLTFPRQVEVG